jgi:hypothetical protein
MHKLALVPLAFIALSIHAKNRPAETTANTYGNTMDATTTASGRCSDVRRFIYTVQVGDTKYDLTPEHSVGASTAAAISPVGLLLIHASSLHNRLPGTPVRLRSDDSGIHVLVGKRETRYAVFGGQ